MSTSEKQESDLTGDDELVAYLDGELPPIDNRRVEERLAADADYRKQLSELDQAWEALDALPRATAGDDFARTTIEMVAVQAQRELSQHEVQVARADRWHRLRWASVAVIAGVLGFTVASIVLPNSDERLLENLPVIRQVDLLEAIRDLDFLRELAAQVPLEDLVRNQHQLEKDLEAIRAASVPESERRAVVLGMSPEEKQTAYGQRGRFESLSAEERARRTKLAQELATDPNRDQLLPVLVAYSQWLQWLNAQAGIRNVRLNDKSLTASERIAEIKEIAERERQVQRNFLSNPEKSRLREEIRSIADQYKAAALDWVRSRSDEELERKEEIIKRLEDGGPGAEYLTVWWALLNGDTFDEIRDRLAKHLDNDSKEYLSQRSRGGNRRSRDVLRSWIGQSLPLPRGDQPADSKALREFFTNVLSVEEKRRLLLDTTFTQFETAVADLFNDQDVGVLEEAMRGGQGRGRGGRGRGRGGPDGDGRGEGRRGGRGRDLELSPLDREPRRGPLDERFGDGKRDQPPL
jgi:hypothetical protein